jgi:hypothetical protein
MGLAFFEIEDQHAKLHVRRIERNKLACMGKRGGEIAGIPKDETSARSVPIRRVTFVGIFEQLHALSSPSLECLQQSIDLSLQLRLVIRF